MHRIRLVDIYGPRLGEETADKVDQLLARFGPRLAGREPGGRTGASNDALLITYGDTLVGEDATPLAALREFGPASQATLGRRTGMDRSDVVATVNDLVARHHAQRTRDQEDRRRNVITITSNGLAHYRRLDKLLVEVQAMLLAPLTGTERQLLMQFLNRILESAPEP